MGKHRINRRLLEHFSFEGRRGELQTWFLGRRNRRPHIRSIEQVGIFEFECSPEIDRYIAVAQSEFENMLDSTLRGREPMLADWDTMVDDIAVQFVRSGSCGAQIELELNRLLADAVISPSQAQDEFNRLLAHRDVDIFRTLVKCSAASFSQCQSVMAVASGERGFITSDKVIHATFDPEEAGRVMNHLVWQPFSPRLGMLLCANGPVDPIFRLTPNGTGQTGALEVTGPPREPLIKGTLEPLEMDDAQADALNALMLAAAHRLFATDPRSIDAAIEFAAEEFGIESPFRYRPAVTVRNRP